MQIACAAMHWGADITHGVRLVFVMTKARATALLATFVLILGSMFAGTTAAHAEDTLVTCLDGDIEIDVDDYDVATVAGTLTDCSALLDGDIESGEISGSGYAIYTFLEIVVVSTETITWNTNQTTTMTVVRSITGLHTVFGVEEGLTVAGLFDPATETGAGTGTRTYGPGGGGHIEWHLEMGLLAQL